MICHFHAGKLLDKKVRGKPTKKSFLNVLNDICKRNEGYQLFQFPAFEGLLTFGQSTTIMAVDEKLFFLLQENCPQWNLPLLLNVFGDVINNLRVEKLVQVNQLGNIHKDSRSVILFEIQVFQDKVLFKHVEHFQVFGLRFYELFQAVIAFLLRNKFTNQFGTLILFEST